MICTACGRPINRATVPGDRSCNWCGFDPDQEEHVAEREAAMEHTFDLKQENE